MAKRSSKGNPFKERSVKHKKMKQATHEMVVNKSGTPSKPMSSHRLAEASTQDTHLYLALSAVKNGGIVPENVRNDLTLEERKKVREEALNRGTYIKVAPCREVITLDLR